MGNLIMAKAHPCGAAMELTSRKGLDWPQAKLNLLARRNPRYHPGEGAKPLLAVDAAQYLLLMVW